MPTYRIDLAYDGSGFHGYARQPGVRTVQGDLEAALTQVIGPLETAVAGRTDAGVHATGQVVSFTTADPVDVDDLHRSLLGMLGPEIATSAVRRVADDFDARFSATWRRYRYQVLNTTVPDPFLRHVTWHVRDPLDRQAMNEATAWFVGEHDFASFCRASARRGTLRTVISAAWSDGGDGLHVFDVAATSFCHQMVRSMVAVLVEVGRGRLTADRIPAIVAAGDRNAARGAAPPHGLSLCEVGYPAEGR